MVTAILKPVKGIFLLDTYYKTDNNNHILDSAEVVVDIVLKPDTFLFLLDNLWDDHMSWGDSRG